jgi:hypothetical protein
MAECLIDKFSRLIKLSGSNWSLNPFVPDTVIVGYHLLPVLMRSRARPDQRLIKYVIRR